MSGADGAHVVVRDVRRLHPGGVLALDGVSLELARGEFVALTGPSGSGKTSLLSIVGALDWPTSGSVLIDGAPIDGAAARARFHRDVVGFVFQHHELLGHLSAHTNVELPLVGAGLPRAARTERAGALLDEVGLRSDRHDEVAGRLSGGERQRVAIARALANDPSLLLADEPTGSLDSDSSRHVLEVLERVRGHHAMTLLVVTYDASIAARADRVLHLRDGRLVDGPGDDVLRAGQQLSA